MPYRRRTRWSNTKDTPQTTINIHWSTTAQCYSIVFQKNSRGFYPKENWKYIKNLFLTFIDNLPFGEKEKIVNIRPDPNYPNDTTKEIQDWTYYIHEKHLKSFQDLVELANENPEITPKIIPISYNHEDRFKVNFLPKPSESNLATNNKIPVDTWLRQFQDVTGFNISGQDYKDAKTIYRKYCMILHPDRNHNDSQAACQMSKLNEAWLNLEIQYFKTKEEVGQLT